MKRLVFIALGMALCVRVGAEVRVRDDAGIDIVLAAPAQRIVSLAPHATEILFEAGAGKRIVGTIKGSDHPPAARSIPLVGDAQALDLERIVALHPDLVVTWPYTMPSQASRLRELGIAVFTTDPASIDGIASAIERLGQLAGTAGPAAQAAARFRSRVAQAHAIARGIARERPVRVFYQIWDQPLFTIGGRHLISQAIRACGGQNVFADLALPAPQVSVEAVLAARPDAIIAGGNGDERPKWLDDWRRWPDLPAAANAQLHAVDADRLHRPGPRFAEGVAQLCEVIGRVPSDR